MACKTSVLHPSSLSMFMLVLAYDSTKESTFLYSSHPAGQKIAIHSPSVGIRVRTSRFVDVGVFNPIAPSRIVTDRSLQSMYCKHEQEKRRQYDQRVREVEHVSFTRPATLFYKRLASKMAEKRDISYAVRCRFRFALLRASIMSVRGVRSPRYHPTTEYPVDLQVVEGHLTSKAYVFAYFVIDSPPNVGTLLFFPFFVLANPSLVFVLPIH